LRFTLPEKWLFHRDPIQSIRPSKYAFLTVFALSLTLRWVFVFFWGGLLLPDATGRYLPVSANLFDHWSGTVYDTPGYPAFLALASGIMGPGVPTLYLQGLLDSLTVVMIFDLACRTITPGPALKVGSFFAIHFGAIVFTAAVLSETLFTFFVVLAVWCFTRSDDRGSWITWSQPGLALGLAAITRANGLATVFAFGFCLLVCRETKAPWRRTAAFLLAAAIPIFGWVQFNARANHVVAVSQGGGWQWLQNLAYFDLVQPETLPQPHRQTYRDWTSLTELRSDLMARHHRNPNRVDPILGAIAKTNATAQPIDYLFNIPSAWLLPRRFIKDTTSKVLNTDHRFPSQDAMTERYAEWLVERHPPAVLKAVYTVARVATVIPYKYSLLIASLPFGLWVAWRQRDGLLLMLVLIPLTQALPLLLLLNPIERYYFPFESLMIIAFFRGFQLRRGKRYPTSIQLQNTKVSP